MLVKISHDQKYASLSTGRGKADILVVCDHPDCGEAVYGRMISRTSMRGKVRARGWSQGKWDLCPAHKGLKIEGEAA